MILIYIYITGFSSKQYQFSLQNTSINGIGKRKETFRKLRRSQGGGRDREGFSVSRPGFPAGLSAPVSRVGACRQPVGRRGHVTRGRSTLKCHTS